MTSHERFHAACEHRDPDRPPVDYLGTPTPTAALRTALACRRSASCSTASAATSAICRAATLAERGRAALLQARRRLRFSETERVCPLGIRWRRGAYDSKFAVDEAIEGPFTDASTVADILAFPWPPPPDFDSCRF
jgi:hypothetical protein